MKKLLLPTLLFLFFACTGTKSIEKKQPSQTLETITHNRFGDDCAIKPNQGATYTLVFKKYKKLEDLFADVHFFIFENDTQTIIFEDTLRQGNVKWIAKNKIRAISFEDKSNEKKSRRNTYLFNVTTKHKEVIDK